MNNTNKKGGGALKAASVLLTIVFMLSLVACKPKEPITAKAFKEKAEALEYSVIDITAEYSEFSHILKALVFEDDSIYVEFLEINNNDNAKGVFNGNQAQLETYKGSSSSETSVNTTSYQKYTLKAVEKYYLIERVGNTLIYAFSDKAEAKKLNNIIKELGY